MRENTRSPIGQILRKTNLQNTPSLSGATKRRIDTARDIPVGKVPDPKSQVEQITIALIYKFMDDMDAESEELGSRRKFFKASSPATAGPSS